MDRAVLTYLPQITPSIRSVPFHQITVVIGVQFCMISYLVAGTTVDSDTGVKALAPNRDVYTSVMLGK